MSPARNNAAFFSGILFACIFCFATAAKQKPPVGPRVTVVKNGKEVWEFPGEDYEVIDYGSYPVPLETTLVYNCAFMPSNCRNVQNYLGYLPVAGSEATFHYDPDNNEPRPRRRKTQRGDMVCPQSWISTPRADGSLRCPERDQPRWSGYRERLEVGPNDAVISQKPGTLEISRLAKNVQKITINADGTSTRTREWKEYGAQLTCDEFPARTWIEGGVSSDGVKSATTYCSPDGRRCGRMIPALVTDQNWQSFAHAGLQYWLRSLRDKVDGKKMDGKKVVKAIFKFKLRTVNNPNARHASWVEANGRKRWCYGPGIHGADKNFGCDRELQSDERLR